MGIDQAVGQWLLQGGTVGPCDAWLRSYSFSMSVWKYFSRVRTRFLTVSGFYLEGPSVALVSHLPRSSL